VLWCKIVYSRLNSYLLELPLLERELEEALLLRLLPEELREEEDDELSRLPDTEVLLSLLVEDDLDPELSRPEDEPDGLVDDPDVFVLPEVEGRLELEVDGRVEVPEEGRELPVDVLLFTLEDGRVEVDVDGLVVVPLEGLVPAPVEGRVDVLEPGLVVVPVLTPGLLLPVEGRLVIVPKSERRLF